MGARAADKMPRKSHHEKNGSAETFEESRRKVAGCCAGSGQQALIETEKDAEEKEPSVEKVGKWCMMPLRGAKRNTTTNKPVTALGRGTLASKKRRKQNRPTPPPQRGGPLWRIRKGTGSVNKRWAHTRREIHFDEGRQRGSVERVNNTVNPVGQNAISSGWSNDWTSEGRKDVAVARKSKLKSLPQHDNKPRSWEENIAEKKGIAPGDIQSEQPFEDAKQQGSTRETAQKQSITWGRRGRSPAICLLGGINHKFKI